MPAVRPGLSATYRRIGNAAGDPYCPLCNALCRDMGQTAPSIHAATAWVLLREMLSRPRS